jgi:peptidyl-prolyl cis-trans isomerase SurA
LENPGDVSKPIQSSFGWHIIRLENISEQKSFDEMKERLIAQGNRGERLRIVATEIRSKIKDKYGFEKDDSYLKFFNSFVDKEVLNRRWKPDTTNANLNKVIFTIGDRDIYYRDFANYIETRHKRPMPKSIKTTEAAIKYIYDDFETATLQEYFRDSLEVENPEYAAIISEYREGLLIFEVMKRNIWDKARNDTLALQAYYEKNKGAYQWNERVDAALLTSTERQALLDSKKLLETGNSSAEVKQELNKDGKVRLLVSNGLFEKKNRNLPENFNFKKGVSEIYESEGNFTLVYVNEILPAGQKSFDEVKGNVMSEYQQILEEQWIQSLRDSNSVVINKKILKKIKKELN